MDKEDQYNPFLEFFRMLGFGRAAKLTPEQLAKLHLDEAKIDLLEAEKKKEAAFAEVEKLKARIRRLANN